MPVLHLVSCTLLLLFLSAWQNTPRGKGGQPVVQKGMEQAVVKYLTTPFTRGGGLIDRIGFKTVQWLGYRNAVIEAVATSNAHGAH